MAKPNRFIFSIQPTHHSDVESNFWKDFGAYITTRGYKLVQFYSPSPSARKFDSDDIITIKYRSFADIGSRYLSSFGLLPSAPSYLPDSFIREVESSYPWIYRKISSHLEFCIGLRCYWSALDLGFRLLRPHAVISTNYTLPSVSACRYFAQFHKSPYKVVERSPLGSLWVESQGIFSESDLWTLSDQELGICNKQHESVNYDAVKYLQNEIEGGFRKFSPQQQDLAGLPRPIVFYPIDNVNQTGWFPENSTQSSADYARLSSPYEMLSRLVAAVSSLGGTLLIKNHPSDQFFKDSPLARHPCVVLVKGGPSAPLRVCDIAVCLLTKLAFNAIALRKPTITLRSNTASRYGDHPYILDNIDDLPGIVDRCWKARKTPMSEFSRFSKYVCFLKSTYYIDFTLPGLSPQSNFFDRLDISADGGGYLLAPGDGIRLVKLIAQGQICMETFGLPPSKSLKHEFSRVIDSKATTRLFNSKMDRNSMIEMYAKRILQSFDASSDSAAGDVNYYYWDVQRLKKLLGV